MSFESDSESDEICLSAALFNEAFFYSGEDEKDDDYEELALDLEVIAPYRKNQTLCRFDNWIYKVEGVFTTSSMCFLTHYNRCQHTGGVFNGNIFKEAKYTFDLKQTDVATRFIYAIFTPQVLREEEDFVHLTVDGYLFNKKI